MARTHASHAWNTGSIPVGATSVRTLSGSNRFFCLYICKNRLPLQRCTFGYSMKQTTEEAMLPFKVVELAELVAEKKNFSLEDALFYVYNSFVYRDLLNPDLKLWYCSGSQLYDFLEEEKMGARKLRPARSVARFVVFCIEQYRLRGGLSPAAVLAMFKEVGVEDFLTRNFEVLHSQSVEYILREIDLFIKKQR